MTCAHLKRHLSPYHLKTTWKKVTAHTQQLSVNKHIKCEQAPHTQAHTSTTHTSTRTHARTHALTWKVLCSIQPYVTYLPTPRWCAEPRLWPTFSLVGPWLKWTLLGLARTIYIRCIYGIFGREITEYTVIYGVYIRFWPTLDTIV